MKYKILGALVLVVLSVAVALAQGPTSTSSTTPAAAASASLSFTAINFPGATRTRALGLNDMGNIVGDFIDSSGVFHGYVLSRGNFTTFDPPGSIQTRGLAINNRGVVLGYSTLGDFPPTTHTFVYDTHGIHDIGTTPTARSIPGSATDTTDLITEPFPAS